MQNMKSVINRHNTRILTEQRQTTDETNCNCRNKDKCPLSGNCLASNVIYQAEVTKTDNKDKELYIGMTAHPLKHRFSNHMKSFRDPKYAKETALSTYIWDLKNEGKEFIVNWSILKRMKGYESGAARCNLCLEEKLYIMKADKKYLLNKRTEIFSKCRHRTKFSIKNFKDANTGKWKRHAVVTTPHIPLE